MSDALERHAARRDRLAERLREGGGQVGLGKETSNLFRDRAGPERRRLDVREFREVLRVDPAAGIVEAEGMASYETLVAACLPQGVMPAVVPQLKTITLGGAVAGVGIEASSHRYGLVHESVLELEVLTGDGRIVVCRPDNEHADLFYALPNSYGTLGYALRVIVRTAPVKRYVRLEHRPFARGEDCFAATAGNPARGGGGLRRRNGVRAGPDVPHARQLRRRPHLSPATTPTARSTTARSPTSARISFQRTTSSGAGTPTGSGARRTCWRRTRCCAACTAARASTRAPTPASCAGTAGSG